MYVFFSENTRFGDASVDYAFLRRLDEPLVKGNEEPGSEGGSGNQIWENVNAQFPSSISRLFRTSSLECFAFSRVLVQFIIEAFPSKYG